MSRLKYTRTHTRAPGGRAGKKMTRTNFFLLEPKAACQERKFHDPATAPTGFTRSRVKSRSWNSRQNSRGGHRSCASCLFSHRFFRCRPPAPLPRTSTATEHLPRTNWPHGIQRRRRRAEFGELNGGPSKEAKKARNDGTLGTLSATTSASTSSSKACGFDGQPQGGALPPRRSVKAPRERRANTLSFGTLFEFIGHVGKL